MDKDTAAKYTLKIADARRKIALIRDLALQLELGPDIIGELQGHYMVKTMQLAEIVKEIE